MGRGWLHWVSGGGDRPSTTRKRRLSAENDEASSAGCMCAVFQLFDLQHHPFTYHPDGPFLQEEATTSKAGMEAPRNSLELVESSSMKAASSMPLAMKEEENSNLPVGINQIKTRVASKSITDDNFSSDCSPGTTKTPNLVARLMGLDLLPECNNSPSLFSCPNSKSQTKLHFSNQKKHTSILHTRSKNCFSDDDIAVGARSSSARRSDFEHHRLSLQINKENKNDEFAISAKMRGKNAKFRHGENTSPAGHFAEHIVNQGKEKVSRKVGLVDITNTDYRDKEEIIRRDQNLVTHIVPKIKSLDTKKKAVISSGTKSARSSTTSSCDSNCDQSRGNLKDGKKVGGGNRNIFSGMEKLQFAPQTCEYSIRNKKSEASVRPTAENKANNLTGKKKKKKLTKKLAPLMSSEIVNISGPTVLPVKKDPSPRATKLPQKQSQVSDALSSKRSTQLSRNPSRSYNQLSLQPDQISTVLPDKNNGFATTAFAAAAAAAAEYKDYVQKILKRAGMNDKLTPLTLGKWHAVSHPLDPSIFYYLELFAGGGGTGHLSLRCNRKLIFQLVDELLAEILKPYLDFKPPIDFSFPVIGIGQFGLCDEVCEKIGDFPAADCRVLEDIDSLIERDLGKLRPNGFFEEEGERLVSEIECEIMEWLVRETLAVVDGGSGGDCTAEEDKQTESRQVSRARAIT